MSKNAKDTTQLLADPEILCATQQMTGTFMETGPKTGCMVLDIVNIMEDVITRAADGYYNGNIIKIYGVHTELTYRREIDYDYTNLQNCHIYSDVSKEYYKTPIIRCKVEFLCTNAVKVEEQYPASLS